MKSRRSSSLAIRNMDSLVDIVSNIVGILVILAAFMALFGLISPSRLDESESAKKESVPPEKLMVPWSHATNKQAVLFQIRGNRILHFDMRAFFQELSTRSGKGKPRAETIRLNRFEVQFFPVTNQVYCMVLAGNPDAGETFLQTNSGNSDWKRVQGLYPPAKFYYFFWVTGDSFELFRRIRSDLWSRQYEVGWKPVAGKSSLEICNGFEGSTGFQPQ